MEESNITAQNTGNVEPQVTSPSTTSTQPEAEVTTPEATGSEQPAAEQPKQRPPRAERRINDLIKKVKEPAGEPARQPNIPASRGPLPWEAPKSPFENFESGQDLDAAVTQKAAAIADLKTRELEQKFEYRRSVESWASDLEETDRRLQDEYKDSPETAKVISSTIADLLEDVSFDKEGNLKPTVKASALYEKVKKAFDAERSRAQVTTAANLSKQASEAAVAPTSVTEDRSAQEEAELHNRARQTGSLDDWSALLKKRLAKK